MAEWAYAALDAASGAAKRGTVFAPSRAEAERQLASQGLLITRLAPSGAARLAFLRLGVGPARVAEAVRNLSDLLATGGVPLLQALGALEQEEPNPRLREIIADLASTVREGRPLAEGMARHPNVFPEVAQRIVAAREARGDLDRALNEAARLLERQVNVSSKVRGALAYPAFILLIAAGVVTFLSVSVLPKLAGMFAQTGVALPLPTRVLMAFGLGLSRYWYLAIAALAAALFGARAALRRPEVRRALDRLAWRLPGVRLFTRNFAYSRWAATVGTMHSSGVPLLETLALARGAAGNAVLAEALAPVAGWVQEGQPLSAALRRTGAVPPTITQLVALGEEHGTLGEMLTRVGRRYEVATERLLEKLPQFIEPAFVVVIGVVVGGILLALYWPLINVYQIAAKGG